MPQVCVGGSPSHQEQGGVARRERDSKPASSPSHSYCKLEMETLRLDLKVVLVLYSCNGLFAKVSKLHVN